MRNVYQFCYDFGTNTENSNKVFIYFIFINKGKKTKSVISFMIEVLIIYEPVP